ncbi:hypothetical protein [Paracoccus sp. (in: a-proteobacteria)]|uniref:hypothetical protein n=1 Tax=Paracoccus sp. TaxID=267 RepID=UPI0035B0A926
MKAILAAIEAKEAEIARLSIEVGALREVYNKEAGIVPEKPRSRRAPRSNVKTAVLDLLKQVGTNGLNAQIAHDLAKEDGVDLHVKSVSSLLSRLKHEGVVVYRDSMYRLTEYEPKTPSAPQMPGVVPLRTSG